jgi:hypothetical protein
MPARHARPARLPRPLGRITWLAVVPLALSLCATFQSGTTAAASVTCPSAVTAARTGNQTTGLTASNSNGTWMLGDAVWNENAPSPITYPIRSDAWTKGCIVGGRVLGSVPKSWTRDQWYNGLNGGTRMGGEAFRQTMTSAPDNFLRIQDAYVEDYEDAYDPNSASTSATTYLDHVSAGYIRDDCVENEQPVHNLVITNSLFDGCFTAFAERPSGSSTATNGAGPQSFTVLDSLVYVQPQPLGTKYCDTSRVSSGRCAATATPGVWLGAYGIWKWSDQAASRVTVRDTVFRLDMPSYSSCQSQKWPAGTYENVTLVWTGKGSYATAGGCKNTLPAGVRLTTDVNVWNAAKSAWASR